MFEHEQLMRLIYARFARVTGEVLANDGVHLYALLKSRANALQYWANARGLRLYRVSFLTHRYEKNPMLAL